MTAPPPAAQSLAVGVVDDHRLNRLVLAQQLRQLGHLPRVAANGHEALQEWLKQPGDVIIVDIQMPEMDGYQFCRLLRAQEAQQGREPCIVLGYTASAGTEERERCRLAGMNDCLLKPIDLLELGERLDRLSQARPAPLDISVVRSLTGGDPQLMDRLLGEILNSCKNDRAALQALQDEAPGPLLELAHHLLGAARVVGAREVTLACEALEAEARQARPMALGDYRQTLVIRLLALEEMLEHLLPDSKPVNCADTP